MSWKECPECGADTMCMDSRPYDDFVRRRYRCRANEDHRWTTLEKIAARFTRYDHTLTLNGKTLTIAEWGKKLRIPPDTIVDRIYVQLLSPEMALRKDRMPRSRTLRVVE